MRVDKQYERLRRHSPEEYIANVCHRVEMCGEKVTVGALKEIIKEHRKERVRQKAVQFLRFAPGEFLDKIEAYLNGLQNDIEPGAIFRESTEEEKQNRKLNSMYGKKKITFDELFPDE